MQIIDKFLDQLYKKINSQIDKKTNNDNYENNVLEINNILFKYQLKELSINDVFVINLEDALKMGELCIFNFDAREFKDNINIITAYDEIIDKYNTNFEAPQYKSSIKYMENYVKVIDDYLKIKIKEDIKPDSDLLEYFKGNCLQKKIVDDAVFHKLFEGLDLKPEERIKVKKNLGVQNYNLLFNVSSNQIIEKNDDDYPELKEYQEYLKNEKKKCKKVYKLIVNEPIDFDDTKKLSLELSRKYNIDADTITCVINCLYVGKIIKDYKLSAEGKKEELLVKLHDFVYGNDSILDKSESIKEDVKKENLEEAVNFNDTKDTFNEEYQQSILLIEKVKKIITREKRLIERIKDNNSLVDVINDNSIEAVNQKIASVITGLFSETEKLRNFIDVKTIRDVVVGNINQYIEAYEILKKQQRKLQENNKKELVYVIASNKKPYFYNDISKFNDEELDNAKYMLEELKYDDLSDIKCFEVMANYQIYRLSYENMKLSFIKLNDSIYLVLGISIANTKETSVIFSDVKNQIDEIYKEIKTEESLETMLKKQQDNNKIIYTLLNDDEVTND